MRTQKQVGFMVTNYYYDSNNNLIAEKTDNATLFSTMTLITDLLKP